MNEIRNNYSNNNATADLSSLPYCSNETNVLYVLKENAKNVKTKLEQLHFISKRYRMTNNIIPEAYQVAQVIDTEILQGLSEIPNYDKCIAIPISNECMDIILSEKNGNTIHPPERVSDFISYVIKMGKQSCPFTTAVLGNTNQRVSSTIMNNSVMSQGDYNDASRQSNTTRDLNIVEKVLRNTIIEFYSTYIKDMTRPSNNLLINETIYNVNNIEHDIIHTLSQNQTCPNKLELFGDDNTLMIPQDALNLKHSNSAGFDSFLDKFITNLLNRNTSAIIKTHDITHTEDDKGTFMTMLWSKLAHVYNSHRVVRKAYIDPSSKIRESGNIILWIDKNYYYEIGSNQTNASVGSEKNIVIKNEDGVNSEGWITVTEQKIKQSFDLTKVMFSRGNISEKIRFGKLVREGEVILDMYAGIGYYTLPALVHGRAKHVVACEWNEHAAFALKYNLKQNGVEDRATIWIGDSKRLADDKEIINVGFDRISLGLLPSSEGGWSCAIQALNREKGGWLHIHGNVPCVERYSWAMWVCQRLSELYHKYVSDQKDVNVLCHRIERVKSFAPKIDHLVADIYCGPILPSYLNMSKFDHLEGVFIGILEPEGNYLKCNPANISPPSCALGNGVLNFDWMIGSDI